MTEEWAALAWLEACRRSAERGVGLHARLHPALKPARSMGRGAAVAEAFGMSKVAAREMLDRAHRVGAIRKLLVRDAFRVYGAA